MYKKANILIVEDEENILDAIKMNLELEDYHVIAVEDGANAVKTFSANMIDMVILDVMLPNKNGFDICREIREIDKTIPILFLTAKDSGEDKIKGLKLGADDYLTKPFNLEELLLRVNNLLIRMGKINRDNIDSNITEYSFGKNKINFKTFEAWGVEGQKIELSKKEASLLKLFIDKKGQVVSRDDILDKVWGKDQYPTTRTIDNFILALRKYFEVNPKNPQYFHSVWGVGYKFTDEN
jgi:two-component system, OmpR family, alkaline phosphatase synthesis response regulator PhoP